MNSPAPRRGATLEELQPQYDDPSGQPKTLTRSRHISDVLYVAGRAPVEGKEEYEIMFVTGAVEEDEAAQYASSVFGVRIHQPPEYLKGANGIVKDVALGVGVDMDRCYYTAVCKWLLPRTQRARPSKKIQRWGLPVLEDEIRRVKPKIIVCMGKQVFDLLGDQTIKFDDAHGCWFWSERYQAHLYVMYAPYNLVGKPEYYGTFRSDFREIARRKEFLDLGADITGSEVNFQVIQNMEDLDEWRQHIEELVTEDRWPANGYRCPDGHPILGVDCEWHGRTHVDGKLRTIQFAWSETDAVVIEFRNEQTEWSFEMGEPEGEIPCQAYEIIDQAVDRARYKAIGKKLANTMGRIDARYIGHHFPADAPWMSNVLGMEVFGKCVMDTEFAQQTVDESSELDLERGISMKYTNLGRYDQDLVMWKRDNKALCKGGYGYIPSAILHPYGAKDVCVPLRAYPIIRRQLAAQGLTQYYDEILNPFVTDVFTEFTMTGLPMDVSMMNELRDLLTFTKDKLNIRLQKRIDKEAGEKLRARIAGSFGLPALMSLQALIKDRAETELLNEVKRRLADQNKLGEVVAWGALIAHYVGAANFNIRSPDQMRRWLFDVEGLTPIKSTNQKAKGLPSMAWESVMELPEDRRSQYTPAVDVQTLKILAEQFPTLDELLSLNAVGNLSKAFLNEPDVYEDPETGEVTTEEHGLHAWLTSDQRITGQYSTTETGRPRSWAPNTLNWPSFVNKRIARAVATCVREAHEEGDLPEHLLRWVGKKEDELPSIRSCVRAPEGMIMVESDFATAEMVALGKISGCKDLCRILEDPDPDWAKLKPNNPYNAKVVRVGFSPSSITGIPETTWKPEFIMNIWEAGKMISKVDEEWLVRDGRGEVVHAKYDIHWSLIERTYQRCRETMKDKTDRTAAKVLNFCCDANSQVVTRDRGAVRLADIRLDDLLWDGVEWVRHEGLIYTGCKEILEYQGLRATRLHDVWTVERGKVKLEEACAQSLTLLRSEVPVSESEAESCEVSWTRLVEVPEVTSRSAIQVEDDFGSHEHGNLERRDFDEACAKFRCGVAETCDIVNAGPRHRFVCNGVLVSNSSAYGATAASLDRKIESDTGVKPEPGTGERGLEAIRERQPRATEFLEEMARVPKEKGFYRAASGRIRHCLLHGAGSGVGWRIRNSLESALGREMRNFPMQESVGATSARACRMLMRAYRRLGLRAKLMTCLYDSVVTLCPLEERFLVARLHQLCMSELNSWAYDDQYGKRVLRYSIDNEFNWRWSTRPSKDEQSMLDDRAFATPSVKLTTLEKHPNLAMLCGLAVDATTGRLVS